MSFAAHSLSLYFPISTWGRQYSLKTLSNDLVAAMIVTIMLVPQSLAYAMLAGLPPESGLYASIAPIVLYALFGTSGSLAVGPVAVVSLLTASAVGQVADQGSIGYATAALTLALLSGGILLVMGILRLGFISNFLSHSVITGFITASGILIAVSQLKHLLGIDASGHTLPEILGSLIAQIHNVNWVTLLLGVSTIALLFSIRKYLKSALIRMGLTLAAADVVTKVGPVMAIALTTLLVWVLELDKRGVSIVGVVPQSLPPFTVPTLNNDLLSTLFIPALLISIIGFVESISVAQTLAAKKRERIDSNQELIGLGAANLGASFSGGFPVTGGFSRSVVNYDAGAKTPAAGIYTAIGLTIAAIGLTPLIHYLPTATLAATIIIAVLSLVDISVLRNTWTYSRVDFAAVVTTMVLTIGLGVEVGVASGVVISIFLYLYKTSKPHVAEVGLVPGAQHFRNIHRHRVETNATVLTLRVDESLYFANAGFLENLIHTRLAEDLKIKHLILMFSAVNEVDYSALHALESINDLLKSKGIALHLSEVKGPVMDRLLRAHFLDNLSGHVYLSQYDAWNALHSNYENCNSPRIIENLQAK